MPSKRTHALRATQDLRGGAQRWSVQSMCRHGYGNQPRMIGRTSDPRAVLVHLAALCADGVAGYRHAAKRTHDPHVRAVLERNAAAREEVASVFAYELVELGYKPSDRGTVAGLLHRRWLDAVELVRHGDAAALVRACSRAERQTIAGFSAALGRELPDHLRSVVESQLGRVLAACAALNREELELGL